MAWPVLRASGQPCRQRQRRAGDALQIKAPSFTFIKGDALDRLKQGRPVRFDLSLAVVSRPGGPVVTQSRQSFNLSYDLWEERFAVTRIGPPPPGSARQVSHSLTSDGKGCRSLVSREHAVVCQRARPGSDGIDLSGYDSTIRSSRRTPRRAPEEDPLTLRGLIDMLSRRRKAAEQEDSLEAGPFRLPD